MTKRNAEETDDNDVINTCADIFRIVEFRYSHVTCFPGEKRAKCEQKTFVDVDDSNPISLFVTMTKLVSLGEDEILFHIRLKRDDVVNNIAKTESDIHHL